MKIDNTWTFNIDNAIRASGFPMKTKIKHNRIEQADIDRAVKLASVPSGTGHDTWLKGCLVSCDITAPQYWWLQWQRYHFHDIVSSKWASCSAATGVLSTEAYAISIDKLIKEHTEKLIRKGYMMPPMPPLTDPAAWLEEQGITEYCINWGSNYIILHKYDLDKLISLNKLDYPQKEGWKFLWGEPREGGWYWKVDGRWEG